MNLSQHTPAQQKVILSEAPAIAVLAGPGSGKTATTVSRIQRLIATGVRPRAIVVFTFTNVAADELQARLYSAAVGDEPGVFPREIKRLGYIGTIHGFALRMLKHCGAPLGFGERLAIVNEDAMADLIASKAQTFNCKMPLDKLLKYKASGVEARKTLRLPVEQLVIGAYYEELREAGLVDFDSILREFHRLLLIPAVCGSDPIPNSFERSISGQFTHLIVDETQDSSRIQWDIFDALPMRFKYFVGDPDQSIFGFNGATPELFQQYAVARDFHVLEENFRSHAEICRAAQRLIMHNRDRLPKATVSVKGPGGSVRVLPPAANTGHEVAQVAEVILSIPPSSRKEVAVLARTNALVREFRDGLKAAGIEVVEAERPNVPADWRKCRALVDLLVNPENDTLASFYLRTQMSQKQVHAHLLGARAAGVSLNTYLRPGLGLSTPELFWVGESLLREGISAESRMLVAEKIKLLPPGSTLLDLSLLLAQNDAPKADVTQGVTVSTIHGAKGKEWDTVIIVGFEDQAMPGKKEAEVEEMRRLAYVAVTRARKDLVLSWAESRVMEWGTVAGNTPSRFIAEMLA